MIKKTIRLGTSDMHRGYTPERCPLIQLLRTRFNLHFTENPDYLLFSVYGGDFKKYHCTRILFSGENEKPNWEECDYAFTNQYSSHPNHYRLPEYALFLNLEDLIKPKSNTINSYVPLEKKKFCNFIYSNPQCRERNRFFKLLSKYKRVDSAGGIYNNMGHRVLNKQSFIQSYKFTIAFENVSSHGYTSEKLAHSMYVGSLPIYWGNPSIDLEFNPRSFINFSDYETLQDLVDRVIEVDKNNSLYTRYMAEPWFHQNQVPKSLTKEAILNQFEKIFNEKKVLTVGMHYVSNRPKYRSSWKTLQLALHGHFFHLLFRVIQRLAKGPTGWSLWQLANSIKQSRNFNHDLNFR